MAKKDKITNEEDVSVASEAIVENKKKSSFGKSLLVFLFLLLAGFAGFVGIKWKQAEKLQVESVRQLQSAYEQKLNVVYSRLQAQDAEISALKERMLSNRSGLSEEDFGRRISDLRESLRNELASEISVFTNSGGNSEIVPAEKQTKEVLLANAAMIIRDLALKGESVEYEMEVLNILAQGSYPAMKYVEDMQKYAKSGVAGKTQLVRDFNKIYAELNYAKMKQEALNKPKTVSYNKKWYEMAWCWFKKLFVAEKKTVRPVFDHKKDEVWLLVNEGKIAEALNALNLSEKYASLSSSPLEVWKERARDYLDFEQAAEGLLLNALASLHLKELEH